jgi:hypothetical protein
MKDEIKNRIEKYKQLNDIHQYESLLSIASDFVANYSNKSTESDELEIGIDIIRGLATLNYLGSLPQYEHDYDLHKRIRHSQIKVFKTCIPLSHIKLRGLTELLLGMKENAVV